MKGRENAKRTAFMRYVRHLMADRDIDEVGELYALMKEAYPETAGPGTVYAYFRDVTTPQPWFLRALEKGFAFDGKPLTPEERDILQDIYLSSY